LTNTGKEMSLKLRKYVLLYEVRKMEEDPEAPPPFESKEFTTLSAARRAAERCDGYWQILKKVNIEDVTPPEDPPGLLWDWEEELVEES